MDAYVSEESLTRSIRVHPNMRTIERMSIKSWLRRLLLDLRSILNFTEFLNRYQERVIFFFSSSRIEEIAG